MSDEGLMFVSIGSRIYQETYQKVQCETKDFGDVFKVEDDVGTDIYISQEEQTHVYNYEPINIFSINDTVHNSRQKLKFRALTDFDSFHTSGLYDAEFLDKRNQYLFRGEQYRSITSSITVSAFPQNPNEWGVAAR